MFFPSAKPSHPWVSLVHSTSLLFSESIVFVCSESVPPLEEAGKCKESLRGRRSGSWKGGKWRVVSGSMKWREKEKAAKGGKGTDTGVSWEDVGATGAWQRTQHWAWNAGHRESAEPVIWITECIQCCSAHGTGLGHHLGRGWNHGNTSVSGIDVTRTKEWFRRGRQFCFRA